MMTLGQANSLHSNINSFVALLLVGVFALLMGLLIWQASFGENPSIKAFSASVAQETQY
jgi:hypothetical protein